MNNVQDIKAYSALIERCFPQIRVHKALPITSGWDSFVLEVNGELIFRFPNSELFYGAYGGGQKFIEQGLAGLRGIFHE